MEQRIKARPNQSLLDMILQGAGSIEAGMQVAVDNGVALSYFPLVNSGILISEAAAVSGDGGVLKYIGQNGVVFGTRGELPMDGLITEDGNNNIVSEDGLDKIVDEF